MNEPLTLGFEEIDDDNESLYLQLCFRLGRPAAYQGRFYMVAVANRFNMLPAFHLTPASADVYAAPASLEGYQTEALTAALSARPGVQAHAVAADSRYTLSLDGVLGEPQPGPITVLEVQRA